MLRLGIDYVGKFIGLVVVGTRTNNVHVYKDVVTKTKTESFATWQKRKKRPNKG